MRENIGHSKDQWVIVENCFNQDALGKSEVIMAQGNGYLGVRSTTEERYCGEVRDTFIAGTFNKAANNEVTELPNVPDVLEISMTINGKKFSLAQGEILKYSKELCLKSGELVRRAEWTSAETGRIAFTWRRFVSLADLHLICQSVEAVALEKDLSIEILSGINGQVTNTGAQHFVEGEKRLFDKSIMTMAQKTSESNITFMGATVHTGYIDNQEQEQDLLILMDRRKIFGKITSKVRKGQSYKFQKYSVLGTDRDLEYQQLSEESLRDRLVEKLRNLKRRSYEELLLESAQLWDTQVWSRVPIQIDSENSFDQLSVRFAQYHLHIMTPAHDSRMGIGAKGLTGEGYKGHSFWDTEVFMFPYFLYTQPEIARQLLVYRYKTLAGARKKAIENGYEGAMFPWESAWTDDGEVTPVWGAADIVTGKSTKIWSGFIEQHITADIAFALFQYYSLTQDEDFMEQYGYEVLFDTAKFWASRLELGTDGAYHINNVIGPDEYKEHVDDNAFTNYLVHMNFELAITYANRLAKTESDLYKRLNTQFNLPQQVEIWQDRMTNIVLPKPNEDGIIPQDNTYLTKEIIDLTPYKNQEHVGSIFTKYNLSQVNNIQVSKQADIMMLFYLREDLFSLEIKRANWEYYEPKTLHDSSLSLSTHSIIANDMGNYPLAYELFTRCREIDLGQNMKSSDHGIHAASLGGLLQCVINGFGGIRVLHGVLRIEPNLPSDWSRLSFPFYWHGYRLEITIDSSGCVVTNKDYCGKTLTFEAWGESYELQESVKIIRNN